MRTLVQGGWIVGFDGAKHELLRDGALVFEDDRIVWTGHRFDGQVDRTVDAAGKLVMPGLVNCHLHLGSNATHAFFLDQTRADYFGSNFYAYAVGRRGAGDQREHDRTDVQQLYGLWSAIRGGATTVVDVGTRNAPEVARLAGEIGARVYIGPPFRSYAYAYDDQGQIQWDPDEASGSAGLQRALAFAREHDGAHNGRVRCLLYPAQLDTCSVDLLRETRRAADESGLRITLHTAMNMVEFHKIVREHRKTPLELLHAIGFLGPDVLLGHCVFHAHHSWAHYPYVDDLALLADSGASIAHAPYKYAKMGIKLESLERYRRRGINVALGTDTYPQDLIHEMRQAGLMARYADGSFRVGKPQDVFDAATLGGAKALGRDDLGRLAPGAKADLLIVDLLGMQYGAVRDPIKSLVECGSASDVDTVIVDGRTLVEGRQPLVVDEAALLKAIQEAGERSWEAAPRWHWSGASVDEIAPMSYAVRDPAQSTGPAPDPA
ncbi:MAG TPA: chlorohydrolase family protein [Chloroflexota bacterium]|nr:chlorohydrolase family protein [Chloroflexota bacterium]